MKKKSLLLIFGSITISSIRRYVYAHVCYSSRVKRKSLYRKSELHMFLLISGGHWCTNPGTPIWRLHTRVYKGAWNVSANNSETVGHKDKILGHIVYILVFLTFHFLGFFHWTVSNVFFCRFGLKMDIDFAYFGLNSSIVFEGIQECMNVFVISIPNEYERKTNIRIRNGSFKKSFVSVLI